MTKLVQTIKDTLSIFSSSKGFTLLELLVVVLIIGILAGIALPQYKEAVLKGEFIKIVTTLHILIDAENRYYLVNGTYTNNRKNLDIDYPLSENEYIVRVSTDLFCYLTGVPDTVYCKNDRLGLTLFYDFNWKFYNCITTNLASSANDDLCKQFTNSEDVFSSSSSYRSYRGTEHTL